MDESVYERGYPADAWPRLIPVLHEVYPVDVSIGRWDDKSTWRLDPHADCTPEQASQAHGVLMQFDPWGASDVDILDPAGAGVGDLPDTEDRGLAEVQEAYEASFDDDASADEVGLAEPADDVPGGDLGAEAVDAGPDDPAADGIAAETAPPDYGGVLVSGDPLLALKMQATWSVGEKEGAIIDEYDIAANAQRLAELRSYALAAKEGAAPDLTDGQKEELQALETFDGWLASVRIYADGLRNAIRAAPDEDALAAVNIFDGWPA